MDPYGCYAREYGALHYGGLLREAAGRGPLRCAPRSPWQAAFLEANLPSQRPRLTVCRGGSYPDLPW